MFQAIDQDIKDSCSGMDFNRSKFYSTSSQDQCVGLNHFFMSKFNTFTLISKHVQINARGMHGRPGKSSLTDQLWTMLTVNGKESPVEYSNPLLIIRAVKGVDSEPALVSSTLGQCRFKYNIMCKI